MDARERHAAAQATAASYLADVEAQYGAAVAQADATREAIEQQLRVTTGALEESRQNRMAEAALAAEHLTRRETELGSELAQAAAFRQDLEGRLADAEGARLAREAELPEVLSAEHDQVRHTLDQLRADHSALEAVSSEHAAERSTLGIRLAERDAEMAAQAASHLASQQASRDALHQIEERLRSVEDASRREVAELQRELNALRQSLQSRPASATSCARKRIGCRY